MWKNKPAAHCSTRLKWPSRLKPMPPPKSPVFLNTKEKFKAAFPEDGAVSFKNITTALGAFERTLLTPTRWDDYLKGNVSALSEQERKGVRAFMDNGCIACHNGVNLGGTMFPKIRLGGRSLLETHRRSKHDKGRADVTKSRRRILLPCSRLEKRRTHLPILPQRQRLGIG